MLQYSRLGDWQSLKQTLDSAVENCVMAGFLIMKPKDDQPPAQADERNLVTVDPHFPDADADDKFFIFWERNGLKVVIAFVVLSVGILTYQALGLFAENQDRKTVAAYSEKVSIDDKVNFAQQNSGHRIAGLAYLEAANMAFEEEDFTRALEYYNQAEAVLPPELAPRARIAKAFAQLQTGDREAARNTLQAVHNDAALPDTARAEAACHLGIMLWEDGDIEGAKSVLQAVSEYKRPSMWGQKATQLIGQIDRS